MNMRNGMRPVHPGEILREELDALGRSVNAVSKALGVPVGQGGSAKRRRTANKPDRSSAPARRATCVVDGDCNPDHEGLNLLREPHPFSPAPAVIPDASLTPFRSVSAIA